LFVVSLVTIDLYKFNIFYISELFRFI